MAVMTDGTVTIRIDGTTYNMTYQTSGDYAGQWTATLTAPSASSYGRNIDVDGTVTSASGQGYYTASITATDTATNTTTETGSNASGATAVQQALMLRVRENTAPTITDVLPASGAYITTSTPTITFKVRDSESGASGINESTIALKINGTAVSGLVTTAVTGGYDVSYTPSTAIPEGSVTLTIDVSDNDGNAATTVTRTFEIDVTAPSLNVSSPTDGAITNSRTITIAGTTDAGVTVTATVNGTDVGSITVAQDGSFTKTHTVSADGTFVVVVTATDIAGNVTGSGNITITINTNMPVISNVTFVPNPADAGATLIAVCTVTEG